MFRYVTYNFHYTVSMYEFNFMFNDVTLKYTQWRESHLTRVRLWVAQAWWARDPARGVPSTAASRTTGLGTGDAGGTRWRPAPTARTLATSPCSEMTAAGKRRVRAFSVRGTTMVCQNWLRIKMVNSLALNGIYYFRQRQQIY